MLAPLVRFHSAAPDVFYVYTMVERDGQELLRRRHRRLRDLATPHKLRAVGVHGAVRTVDMEPDPDWLQRIAAARHTSIPTFSTTTTATFCPGTRRSTTAQGRYSGFVGVDFDIDYYLAQEASFRAISIGTLIAAVLVAALSSATSPRAITTAQDHRIEEQ